MTRRQLRRITLMVICTYVLAILLGILLRVCDTGPDWIIYSTYKDLIPLIIAIPAAYLAFSFQRRSSYVQAMRAYWSMLVRAVQSAYCYTYECQPSFEQHCRVLKELRIVIDEARGVFENIRIPEDPRGWYPFQPIKDMYKDILVFGYGVNVSLEEQEALRSRIDKRWKLVRSELLREFDRDVPTHHYAWYTISHLHLR